MRKHLGLQIGGSLEAHIPKKLIGCGSLSWVSCSAFSLPNLCFREPASATATFSRAVRSPNRLVIWNVLATHAARDDER